MIVTVTLNPAIDKTSYIENTIIPHGLNRVSRFVLSAGGKGINVSKTVKALGGKSLATGFMGLDNHELITSALDELEIKHDFVYVDGSVRTNLKIADADGSITEINESGFYVPKEAIDKLIDKLKGVANTDTLFVLSGSAPASVPKNIYRVITEEVKKCGAAVLLDADGELFSEGVKAIPDFVKQNKYEITSYFHYSEDTDEIISLGRSLIDRGIKHVVISMGSEGALFLDENESEMYNAPEVEVKSTVGAGDAMVAAIGYALDTGLDSRKTAYLAMATAAGAIMTEGTEPADRAVIDKILNSFENIS